MELTGRQREFLESFLDMYHNVQGPLHYSQVAEQLGVSKITAYDMLKLLEKRDLVQAEYLLPERGQGPGRSTIVFRPTVKAHDLFSELTGDEWDETEWTQVRERILEALHSERYTDYQELIAELMIRIPESANPMVYAAEMITAMILFLHQTRVSATVSLEETLQKLGLPGELGLSALAGLSLGLSFVEKANRRLTQLLTSHTSRYQSIMSRLSSENRQQLSGFAQDVVRQIEPPGDRTTSL